MKIEQKFEYGLQGQFKVDVYDQKGELVDTTDYFDNFITQTGLNYPLDYNFADCFRYLTLGRNGGANNMGVTGLLPQPTVVEAMVKNYDNNQISYQEWEYLGDAHLDKNSNSSAGSCGTIVGADGPSFYRGWKLPTGDNVFTEGQTTISEFMVSPSTGLDPTGKYAFSRVPRSVSIPSGTRTIVTYMLNVKIKHTGVNYFHSGTFNTGEAEVSEQVHLVSGFGNLSGYYRQCYHGLRCVDNQGRTFIPKYGDPMEPSQVRLDQLAIYFSPDNSQFDVNIHGGGQSSVSNAYSSDGLCALSFNHDLAANANVGDDEIHNNAKMSLSSLPSDASSPFEHHNNIRLKASSSERPPRLGNYTKSTDQTVDLNTSVYNYLEMGTNGDSAVSMATFGEQSYRSSEFDRGFKVAFSSMMSNLGVNVAGFTGRRRNIVRKAFITPINALGHNSRFGSLVYAFKNGSTYWPAVDCMFFDSSGRSTMQHYRVFSGCHLTERGKGIIKSTLTTDPRTYGGFHVETVHGPIVYDSTLGSSNITGHSGFYEETSVYQNWEWVTTPATAVRISGDIPAGYTVPGDTGDFAPDHDDAGKVIVDDTKYYGVGAIQGHLNPSAFDYGISDHRVEIWSPVPSNHPSYDASNPAKLVKVREPIQAPPNTVGLDGKGYAFSTDDIYWPTVQDGKLNFKVTDLNYYDRGVGVLPDKELHFSASEQIVADVDFVKQAQTNLMETYVPIPNSTDYVDLSSVTQNYISNTQAVGFFLSRETGWLEVDGFNTEGDYDANATYSKYAIVADKTNGSTVAAGAVMYESLVASNQGNALTSTAHWKQLSVIPWTGKLQQQADGNSPTPASTAQRNAWIDLNDQKITGYLVPSTHMYNGDIVNTTWVSNSSFPPAGAIEVPVDVTLPTVEPFIGPDNSTYRTKVGMPQQLFDGFGSYPTKATHMVARRSGDGKKATDGPGMALVFTGCDATAGGSEKSNPIYVVAGRAVQADGDWDWNPLASFTGTVRMTDFIPPQGYFVHYESTRLLPNFATGSATSDSYPRNIIKQGGVYPGMSNLNTLEIYMDVSWSAPCAGVVGCVEQEA